MDANARNIGEIFDQKIRLTAPLFQRPYVWNEERNWQPLWEAIQDVAERRLFGKHLRPRFLGAVVLTQLKTKTGEVETRQVIDGQQRLTTLQLSLAGMRDVVREMGDDDYERSFVDLTRNHIPSRKSTDNVFKFWPTNRDRDHFKRTMLAKSPAALLKEYGVPESAQTCGSLIPDAYLFFFRMVKDWLNAATVPSSEEAEEDADTLERRLECLLDAMRRDVVLVVIDLGDDDDPQMIFETLNAFGTPLLPADLVKNFLFHKAQNEGVDLQELYEGTWKQFEDDSSYWRKEVKIGRLKRPQLDVFLQHYLALRTQDEAVSTNIFGTFKDFILDGEPRTAAEHLADLRVYANVYKSFSEFPPSSPEAVFFERLELLDTTTAYPFLLEVFRNPVSGDDRRRIITDLESYFVRRAVCGWTTKNYNRMFADLIKRCAKDGFSSEVVRDYLVERTGEAAKWPNDKELEWCFVESPVYRKLIRQRTRMVLEAIESQMFDEKTENIEIKEKLTIEHLLPQQWQENWPLPHDADEDERDRLLHTFGNLTLVTKKLNPSMSNAAWNKKKKALQDHSALTMNRRLRDSQTWGEKEIKARGHELFKLAAEIWPRPESGSDGEIIIADVSDGLTKRKCREMRGRYWAEVARRINEAAYLPSTVQAKKTEALTLPFGRKSFRLSPFVDPEHRRIGVSLLCRSKLAMENQKALQEERDAIETEIGDQLEWAEEDDSTQSTSLYWNDVDCYDESHWPAQHDWLNEKLLMFFRQFDERCKRLLPKQGKKPDELEQRFEFWKLFRGKVLQETDFEPSKATRGARMSFGMEHPAFFLEARTSRSGDRITSVFGCMTNHDEIESESVTSALASAVDELAIDVELMDRRAKQNQLRISASAEFDVSDGWDEVWEDQHDWLLSSLVALNDFFAPRLAELAKS